MGRCGGLGRRDRLKIYYPKGCVGSTPSVGTNKINGSVRLVNIWGQSGDNGGHESSFGQSCQPTEKKAVRGATRQRELPIYTTQNVVAGVKYLRHEVVWYDADGRRCKQRFNDLGQAKSEAERVVTKLANCEKETLKLSAGDRVQLVESQELLKPFNLSVGSAIREFVTARQKLPPGQSLIEAADYFRKRNPVQR